MRTKAPDRRHLTTQKVRVGNQTAYVGMGEDEAGNLVEIWLDVSRCGSSLRGLLDTLARVFSVSLQHGVPLAALTAAMRGMAFPPDGPVTGSPHVAEARSIVDYVARELEATYLSEPKEESA